MFEYDLVRVFEHPLKFRAVIPYAIVALGGSLSGECAVEVQWRRSPAEPEHHDTLVLRWDTATLKPHFAEIEEEIAIVRDRDEDVPRRMEFAAIASAVAVMAHIAPGVLFTHRSNIGSGHDYYLNDSTGEMIEIAGRLEGGLPSLFEEKRQQSATNPRLRQRWVSVTIFSKKPRNRTERLTP